MKFVLYVEGETEQKALPRLLRAWLTPQLKEPVGITAVNLFGWSNWTDLQKKVRLHFSGRAGAATIAAIGLLDLHGPDFYPPGQRSAEERYRWAKAHIEREVGHPKFLQHFAVHETEAWLLADPDNFPKELTSFIRPFAGSPETVDFDNPPARRLDALYRQRLKRPYQKTKDGINLFEKLAPACPASCCAWRGRRGCEGADRARTDLS